MNSYISEREYHERTWRGLVGALGAVKVAALRSVPLHVIVAYKEAMENGGPAVAPSPVMAIQKMASRTAATQSKWLDIKQGLASIRYLEDNGYQVFGKRAGVADSLKGGLAALKKSRIAQGAGLALGATAIGVPAANYVSDRAIDRAESKAKSNLPLAALAIAGGNFLGTTLGTMAGNRLGSKGSNNNNNNSGARR